MFFIWIKYFFKRTVVISNSKLSFHTSVLRSYYGFNPSVIRRCISNFLPLAVIIFIIILKCIVLIFALLYRHFVDTVKSCNTFQFRHEYKRTITCAVIAPYCIHRVIVGKRILYRLYTFRITVAEKFNSYRVSVFISVPSPWIFRIINIVTFWIL